MNTSNFSVTHEDFQNYSWQEVIEKAPSKQCHCYYELFFAKAAELEKTGDERGARVFRFLGAITSLHPTYENEDEPYGALWREQTRRSTIAADFVKEDFDVLQKLMPETRDAELKARFADLLWIAKQTKRDHQAAKEAVYAFIDSAKQLENPERWPLCFPAIQRAVQIAYTLGRNKEPFIDAIKYVETLLDKYGTTDTGLFCFKLQELLLDYEMGDSSKYIPLSESLALRVEANNAPFFARSYWETKLRWHLKAKDEVGAKQTRIRSAETYIAEAEQALKRPTPSYSAAASFLARAVEALRRAGGDEKSIQELHQRLLTYQKQSLSEMSSIPFNADISQLVKTAIDGVKGKPLREAVFWLASANPPTNVTVLKKQIEENAKNYPESHIFSAVFLDDEGRVIAHKPGMFTTDKEQLELAIEAEMFNNARTVYWPLKMQGFIEPARAVIEAEHRPQVRDLAFLVVDNPFVPPGREGIFARGLQAGFVGNWLVAAHLLIPQVESSIRYVLGQRGIIVSKLDSKLIQEVRLLDKLLAMPETLEIFGENTVFDLRGIFVEKFGCNLRNRLAHGLMPESRFYSYDVIYAWFIILQLCCITLIMQEQQEIPKPPTENA